MTASGVRASSLSGPRFRERLKILSERCPRFLNCFLWLSFCSFVVIVVVPVVVIVVVVVVIAAIVVVVLVARVFDLFSAFKFLLFQMKLLFSR